MSKEALVEAIQPILHLLESANLSEPTELQSELENAFPLDGKEIMDIETLVHQGLNDGWLCPRGDEKLRYGRLLKADKEKDGFGVDTVDMRGPGPGHTHPLGEVDLCFAIEGDPLFDGRKPGWTVYGPKSWHVPTVSGGRMGILYFLPKGAIRFEPKPQ